MDPSYKPGHPEIEPWPNPAYIVLPPQTITTIVAAAPWGSTVGEQTSRASTVYGSGQWSRQTAEQVDQLLSAIIACGHPTVRREDASTALRVVRAAVAGYTGAWPASVLLWDPTRDGDPPPPEWAPPAPLLPVHADEPVS